ncbi:MAG: hypothetical protein IKN17_07225 [Ruminococcus sp.]|nr:hypothetical protein [Ruminococcus sp.]
MAVTIDELIKQILALYDDLPDDAVMDEIYRSIFGEKEGNTVEQERDRCPCSKSESRGQSGI